MNVRALLLQLFILGLVPLMIYAPYVGVYGYYWYSFGGPHSEAYGLPNLDWGKIIAGAALLSWLFSRGTKKIPVNGVTIFMVLLFLWTCVTTMFARFPDPAYDHLVEWSKVVLMAVVTLGVITNRVRLHGLIWILVLSIGFHGFKGGVFTLVAGGNFDVQGPEHTNIYGTNEVARAFMMTIPLTFYLVIQSRHAWVRISMLVLTGFSILALLGTNSRSALLAFGLMCFVLWLYSRRKLLYIVAFVVACALGLAVLPQARLDGMFARYSSVQSYETDTSLLGRFEIWERITSYALRSPVVGGGFTLPERGLGRAAHNSYFEVLGEHGFVGLFFYLCMGFAALGMTFRLIVLGRRAPEFFWARDLGIMLQCSLVGYFAGGLTKNHGFFELYYVQLALLVCAITIVRRQLASWAEEERKADFARQMSGANAYVTRQPGVPP